MYKFFKICVQVKLRSHRYYFTVNNSRFEHGLILDLHCICEGYYYKQTAFI